MSIGLWDLGIEQVVDIMLDNGTRNGVINGVHDMGVLSSVVGLTSCNLVAFVPCRFDSYRTHQIS